MGYGKIWALEHRAVQNIFLPGRVVVQEKVDGSFISFFRREGGPLRVFSKGTEIDIDHPDKMFSAGVAYLKTIEHELDHSLVYYGEYLRVPRHNTLAYERVPLNHIILFDVEVNAGSQTYLYPSSLQEEAARLGLEAVPFFEFSDDLSPLLENMSVLGGQKIEGVVVKNYSRYDVDGKILKAKLVSSIFKEIHGRTWKESNPSQTDFRKRLGDKYTTPARWNKAIFRLRDEGKLTNTPSDIGKLMAEIKNDILVECADEIKEALFNWAWPDISRAVVRGFAPYYLSAIMTSEEDGTIPQEVSSTSPAVDVSTES